MRPLVIVLVVFALGIAGLTAFLARNFIDQPAPVVEVQPDTAVLVAARDIAPGAIIIDEDLRYEEWPAGSVDPRFLVRSKDGGDPRGNVVGAVAARAIAKGEPLSGSAVFRQDEAGHLAGMIGPGMRAVSVSISETSAVAGFITPGVRVDVVLVTSFTPPADEEFGETDDELYVSEVLLRDVRVVAIDTNLASTGPAMTGRTATLEVTPAEAEKLVLAGMAGRLHLTLRSSIADRSLENEELITSVEASRAMQTYSRLASMVGDGPRGKDEFRAAAEEMAKRMQEIEANYRNLRRENERLAAEREELLKSERPLPPELTERMGEIERRMADLKRENTRLAAERNRPRPLPESQPELVLPEIPEEDKPPRTVTLNRAGMIEVRTFPN